MNVLLPQCTTTTMYYYNVLVYPPRAPHVIVRTISGLNLLRPACLQLSSWAHWPQFKTSSKLTNIEFLAATSPPEFLSPSAAMLIAQLVQVLPILFMYNFTKTI